MFAKKTVHLAILTLAVLLLCACAFQPQGESSQESPVGMADPSAVFCEEEGHTFEIRTADDGSGSGACVFDDGTECDSWAFFSGECKPGGE